MGAGHLENRNKESRVDGAAKNMRALTPLRNLDTWRADITPSMGGCAAAPRGLHAIAPLRLASEVGIVTRSASELQQRWQQGASQALPYTAIDARPLAENQRSLLRQGPRARPTSARAVAAPAGREVLASPRPHPAKASTAGHRAPRLGSRGVATRRSRPSRPRRTRQHRPLPRARSHVRAALAATSILRDGPRWRGEPEGHCVPHARRHHAHLPAMRRAPQRILGFADFTFERTARTASEATKRLGNPSAEPLGRITTWAPTRDPATAAAGASTNSTRSKTPWRDVRPRRSVALS